MKIKTELEDLIQSVKDGEAPPKLLIHSCCAPCSSYVLEYLSEFFKISVFYYNPNISPQEEYNRRLQEQKTFILEFKTKYEVDFTEGKYVTDSFFALAKGLEGEIEGGERCFKCYRLRLNETAITAKKTGFDYFTTTLSVSPYKNADKLNELGKELSDIHGVKYLYSNFKKNNGYKRSIELSKEFNLYRQEYCGCIFSKKGV